MTILTRLRSEETGSRELDAETKVQTEMRDDILRLKSAMVKNGWIEA